MSNFTRTQRLRALALPVVAIAALAGCSAAAPGAAPNSSESTEESRTLQLSTYLGPTTPYGQTLEWFAAEAEERSNGSLKIELYWEGALLSGPDTITGVRDGRADMGYTTTAYNPAELPLTQVLSVPFITDDLVAAEEAFVELYKTNEDLQAEWEATGVIPLVVVPTSPMVMVGVEPIDSFEALQGLSIRATSLTGNAVQSAGGNAVALALPEVYESIQRGLIAGATSIPLGTVPSVSLQEVAPHLIDPGAGLYSATDMVINTAVYEGLSDGHRELLDELSVEFRDVYLGFDATADVAACDLMLEAGGTATAWSDEDIQQWKDVLGTSIIDQWTEAASAAGADAEAFFDQYTALLESGASDYQSGVALCVERAA